MSENLASSDVNAAPAAAAPTHHDAVAAIDARLAALGVNIASAIAGIRADLAQIPEVVKSDVQRGVDWLTSHL